MTKRRIFDSIITRLVIMVVCLVTVGTVIRYFALGHFLRQDLTIVVQEQQQALAGYVARDIDDKITQRQTLLKQLAADLPQALLSRPAALQDWLRQHYRYQSLFPGGLFVTDRHGRVIADYPTAPGRQNHSYADRDYIQVAAKGSGYIGKPVIGYALRLPILPMATPLFDNNKQVSGILVGITPLSSPGFLDLLQKTQIGHGKGGFQLVSPRDNLYVASSQQALALAPLPVPGSNPLHDRAMAGYRGSGISSNAAGEEEVLAMATVPSTNWFVVAQVPASEAFATVGHAQIFAIKSAIVATILFGLLATGCMYFVLRPLFHAAEDAERMAHGDIPLVPLSIRRMDEVGHLIAAFNRLLGKLHEQQGQLERLAHHDTLTGLPNRRLLADRLKLALAQSRRHGTHLALLFMDLDGFKRINDSQGHDAGDEALRMVTERLQAIVRESDTLARIGGDEFVLLMSHLDTRAAETARIVADKCIAAMQQPLSINGASCKVGISIGIAMDTPASTADSLMQQADQAMYLAKHCGGDCLRQV
ncbi:diguanylate cyclase [Aquitalea magnusonii]|uniref:Diguanylate cyclase n=1 Tax=Aquitalea magnusonii TaxID=332411 RepID=A0A3G9GB84_9NEIS|nr:GGDEF domain-containing protein [Aquitalea magnusonii]BBF84634.1 diguanylate cyclase [Aquitalea magnusonii]